MRHLIWSVLVFATAAEAVPTTVATQGRVLSATGEPLNGEFPLTFSLYASETAESFEWQEMQTVSLVDGYYSARLGTDAPLDGDILDGSSLWLEVDHGGGQPMRRPLDSVPYAVQAGLPTVSCPAGSVLTGFDGTGPVCLVMLPGTNLLDNAGMEVAWTVGGDRSAATGWHVAGSISTNELDPAPSAGATALQIGGSGFAYQVVDRTGELAGRTLTLSVDIRESDGGSSIRIDDGVSETVHAVPAVPSVYRRESVTHTVHPQATHVAVKLVPGPTTAAYDNATLVAADLGGEHAPFVPTDPVQDTLAGLRWYETGLARIDIADNYDNSHSASGPVLNFRVPKPAIPTVALTGGEYKCKNYDQTGTPVTGIQASAPTSGGDPMSATFSCNQMACGTAIELAGVGQGQHCIIRWNWTASVDEGTY